MSYHFQGILKQGKYNNTCIFGLFDPVHKRELVFVDEGKWTDNSKNILSFLPKYLLVFRNAILFTVSCH